MLEQTTLLFVFGLFASTAALIKAARAHGLSAVATFDVANNDGIQVQLEPAQVDRSPLFEAIPKRQSTRTEYDGKPLTNEELKLLEHAGAGNGTRVASADGSRGHGEGA